MEIDYSLILSRRFGGKVWSIIGYDYDTLEWLDESPKPTRKQLDALWNSVQLEVTTETQERQLVRESALAKLAKLGLTEDEVRVIVGA